jgi:phosphoglycolate phosphatase
MAGARKLVDGARTVVFDLDGTLVDTLGDLWTALNTALAQHDLPGAPREAVLANVHLGLEGTVRAVLGGLAADATRTPAIARSYEAAYRAREHAASSLYPGVRDFLDACARQGRSMAVCTNKAAGDARDLLSLLRIADFFQVVTGIDTCGFAKPHPAPLMATLERLGCAPEDAVFIGDSVVDARCAANAEVAFLLHESGYGAEDALAFGCGGRFRGYGELAHEAAASSKADSLEP